MCHIIRGRGIPLPPHRATKRAAGTPGLAALLVARIAPLCSLLAPCHPHPTAHITRGGGPGPGAALRDLCNPSRFQGTRTTFPGDRHSDARKNSREARCRGWASAPLTAANTLLYKVICNRHQATEMRPTRRTGEGWNPAGGPWCRSRRDTSRGLADEPPAGPPLRRPSAREGSLVHGRRGDGARARHRHECDACSRWSIRFSSAACPSRIPIASCTSASATP